MSRGDYEVGDTDYGHGHALGFRIQAQEVPKPDTSWNAFCDDVQHDPRLTSRNKLQEWRDWQNKINAR